VGFESDEIQEALNWLDGLAGTAQAYSGQQSPSAMRVYSPAEQELLGEESIGFRQLPRIGRRAAAADARNGDRPRQRDRRHADRTGRPEGHRLMVFWSLGEEPDALILDELFVAPEERLIH
jgi:Smg protein